MQHDATHELTFDYSPIKCQIDKNNVSLMDINPEEDLNFELKLDGTIFSYDPDDLSNNDLNYNWTCFDQDNNSCLSALSTVKKGIINVDLSTLTVKYDSYIIFNRNDCVL